MTLRITAGFCLLFLLASCHSTEKYYIRNFTTDPVTVYLSGDSSLQTLSDVRIQKDNVLHALALVETPYPEQAVVAVDSGGLRSFIIPPMGTAYVGEKSEGSKRLEHSRFFLQNGRELLWIRHETGVQPYIYYYDFK